mmetsp:Transcript_54790/g.142634  ORF Transcript_54790/g.142634 Transcript_54790/m.142634 type:complete len:336 (+) Transcript_54790:394-1401(+)
MSSLAPAHRDVRVALDVVDAGAGDGAPSSTRRDLECDARQLGLQLILDPLRHALLLVRPGLIPLAAAALHVRRYRLRWVLQFLRLSEARLLYQLLGLVRDVRVEKGRGLAVCGLLVPAHPRVLLAHLLRLLFRRRSRRGRVVKLHAHVLRIFLEPGLVGRVLLLQLLGLLHELRPRLVVGLELPALLGRSHRVVELVEPSERGRLPVKGLDKCGVYLDALVGIGQGLLNLIQVQPDHGPVRIQRRLPLVRETLQHRDGFAVKELRAGHVLLGESALGAVLHLGHQPQLAGLVWGLLVEHVRMAIGGVGVGSGPSHTLASEGGAREALGPLTPKTA